MYLPFLASCILATVGKPLHNLDYYGVLRINI